MVRASFCGSLRIRHRNVLTTKAWEDAVQGLGLGLESLSNSRNKEPIPQNKQKRFSFQIESRTLDVVVSVSLHLYNVSKLILDNLGARLYRN